MLNDTLERVFSNLTQIRAIQLYVSECKVSMY